MSFWFYYIVGVSAPKTPIFAPTLGYICNYIIELSISVPPNHIFAPHTS